MGLARLALLYGDTEKASMYLDKLDEVWEDAFNSFGKHNG